MATRATHGPEALTEKEKQTLRLMLRGHDAKSIARSLDLSVHTINERLRDARRKLAVSSSREAARLLLDTEGGSIDVLGHNSLGDSRIGEAEARPTVDQGAAPMVGAGRPRRFLIAIGVIAMTLTVGFLALSILSQAVSGPAQSPPATAQSADPVLVDTARQFLTLIDQANWDASYAATGADFHKQNSLQVWTDVSQKVRAPLGAMVSRTFLSAQDSAQDLPVPPSGYQVVKFRTSFANKADVVETVALGREGGAWKVVGVVIE